MLDAVPNIIAAAVILLVTWYVARFAADLLARLLARLLESAGFDAMPARLGMGEALSGDTRPSRIAHWAVMFFAMLFAVVEASDQLGFWLANLAYKAIARAGCVDAGRAAGLAEVARNAILGVVIAMGLRAMGIANEIVQLAFGLSLGAVAVALSFGLGGREAAGKLLEH